MGPNLDERLNFNVGLVISPKIHGRYKHLRRKNIHVNSNWCGTSAESGGLLHLRETLREGHTRAVASYKLRKIKIMHLFLQLMTTKFNH